MFVRKPDNTQFVSDLIMDKTFLKSKHYILWNPSSRVNLIYLLLLTMRFEDEKSSVHNKSSVLPIPFSLSRSNSVRNVHIPYQLDLVCDDFILSNRKDHDSWKMYTQQRAKWTNPLLPLGYPQRIICCANMRLPNRWFANNLPM